MILLLGALLIALLIALLLRGVRVGGDHTNDAPVGQAPTHAIDGEKMAVRTVGGQKAVQ